MKAINLYRQGGIYRWAWLCLFFGLSFSFVMAQTPANSTVSGTVTGNNDVRASTINSTQIISSGKTDYWAENEIVLNPGFEVKADATFTANMERDSLHHVKMLTYNLWGDNSDYAEHAKVIKNSGADVVSVQEVRREANFDKLKANSGLAGRMCVTDKKGFHKYGIGVLWNESRLGAPIEIKEEVMSTWYDSWDNNRGFIVAEFNDFCFVATHYSDYRIYRITMTEAILSHYIVTRCFNAGKPVYIAGDLNEQAKAEDQPAITLFKTHGFTILNNISDPTHRTFPNSSDTELGYIDLILEHNIKSYHKTIDRGIPVKTDGSWKLSDHYPYMVRVKIK